MTEIVIFGGTTEGRKLCEMCTEQMLSVIYCVATPDGARPVEALPNIKVCVGRLEVSQMAALLKNHCPALVFDATHPYARLVTQNIAAACEQTGFSLIRLCRESNNDKNCILFNSDEDLLEWLKNEPGNIFSTTGASFAKLYAKLPDYKNRLWMRILPSAESLQICFDAGYSPNRLICIQGPFSEELNCAMFQNANARILVTKNSGSPGGFYEKVRAAKSLGMLVAVICNPEDSHGISLEEAQRIILELSK